MQDNIVAVIAVLVTVGLPIGAWITTIVFRHQERMEMLRRGIIPPPDLRGRAWREWARQNSGWPQQPQAGAVPPPQPPPWSTSRPVPPPQAQWGPADDPQLALYKGIRVALVGLALTIGIGIAFGGYRGNPIILGGLVPLFVGIAQIIIAVLSGAQLPGVSPSITIIPPPQPPPPPGPQPPPGPHFEELSKPTQPPDLR